MKHFINGIEVSPRNINDIGLVSDFTGDPEILKLNTDTIVLTREAYDLVKNHVDTQGVFEGIPYRIELSYNVTLEYYIDLLDNVLWKDHEVEVTIKQRKNWDNFYDKAVGTSFELLLTKGVQFNTIDVPYLIVKDNQAELAFTTAITLFSLYKTFAEAIQDLQFAIAEFQDAIGLDPSDVIASAIKLAARLIYIAALYLLIIELLNRLIEIIYPPVQYLKGCKVIELMEVSCQEFGYTFQSTLLDEISGITILPVPLLKEGKSIFENLVPSLLNNVWSTGLPGGSDSIPTVWSLFEQMEVMFNARTRISNNVVEFERRDYWENLVNMEILPALVLQSDRSDAFRYNTEEVWKRYYMHYQIDYTDLHTSDKIYEYNDAEFSTESINFINEDLVSIKSLQEVNISLALGSRKTELSYAEKIVFGVFTIIDLLTAILTFGNGTDFSGTVTSRIGMLQIGSQFFGTTKVLYLVNDRQPTDWYDYLSAKTLWDKYHYINQITLNSYEIRENARIRIRSQDFVNLLDNNYAEIDGQICEILRLEYIDEKGFANVSYKKPSNYAQGKVTNIVINE